MIRILIVGYCFGALTDAGIERLQARAGGLAFH